MNIDTKRLAADPGYWGSVAPKGATHYDPTDSGLRAWMMKVDERAWCFREDSGWESVDYSDVAHNIHDYIPRPKKSEVEWGGEFPPVGSELDYVIGDQRYPVTVVGHYDDEVVVFQHESAPDYVGVQPGYLKPQRTKRQRQRDEIIDEAWTAINQDYSEESTRQTNPQEYVLNAICQLYDAGMLHKPEGE